jgi:hypothetical protein
MPYVKTITFFVFMLSLLLPVLGYQQSSEYIILVSIFTFLIWVLSLTKGFISNLIAVILTAYFSQRMLMYYVFPENFSYKWVADVQINEALIFSISVLLAMVFGSMMFQIIYGRINHQSIISFSGDKFLGINIRFEELIKMISLFVIFALALKLYTSFSLGIVVGSESWVGQKSSFESFLLRGSQIFLSLSLLLLIVVSRRDLFSQHTRMFAIFLIVIFLMFNVLVETSKGALLSMMLFYMIILNYSRNRVSKKVMLYSIVIFLLTLFFFSIFMIWYRNIFIAYLGGDSGYLFEYDFNRAILTFSKRLGGFDWLTGIMAYQGNEFNYPGSIYHQIVQLINYFAPGKVIHEQNYMPISQGMGVLLSNKPESDPTRHLPGGLAMSYLAFGWWSFLYYGCIVFFLRYISKFSEQFFLKVILVYFFAVHHFVAGTGLLLLLSNMFVGLIITVFFVRFLRTLTITNRKVIVK